MSINKNQIDIPKEAPFQNDKLNRKPFAEQLTNMVKNNQDGLVLSLTGQWGEGKTTFINMWKAHLENEKIPCIYFDAFEHDHMDNPFLSIATEINDFVQNNEKIEDNKKENFTEKSKKISKKLLKLTGRLGLKALTLNIISDSEIDTLENLKEDLADSISSQFSSFIEEQFDNHQQNKDLFNSYKDILSEIAQQSREEDVPLVIIVDELDRCKPTYAIEVLEKIKHFFSVPNIVFVLSMNQNQLEESIKAVYGRNIDANTYLQKFIDVSTTIPKSKFTQHENDFLYWKLKQYVDIESIENPLYINTILKNLANSYNLSYRQIERVLLNIKLLLNTFDRNWLSFVLLVLVTFISVLKVVQPNLITRIKENNINYTDFIRELEYKNNRDYENELLFNFLGCCFQSKDYFTQRDITDQYINDFFRSFITYFDENKSNIVLKSLIVRLESFNRDEHL